MTKINDASNTTETDKVLGLVSKNLETAYTTLAALKQEQTVIDAKIEDLSRVVLALERTKNTLSIGIPIEQTFERSFKDDAEDRYNLALAKVEEDNAA